MAYAKEKRGGKGTDFEVARMGAEQEWGFIVWGKQGLVENV